MRSPPQLQESGLTSGKSKMSKQAFEETNPPFTKGLHYKPPTRDERNLGCVVMARRLHHDPANRIEGRVP